MTPEDEAQPRESERGLGTPPGRERVAHAWPPFRGSRSVSVDAVTASSERGHPKATGALCLEGGGRVRRGGERHGTLRQALVLQVAAPGRPSTSMRLQTRFFCAGYARITRTLPLPPRYGPIGADAWELAR